MQRNIHNMNKTHNARRVGRVNTLSNMSQASSRTSCQVQSFSFQSDRSNSMDKDTRTKMLHVINFWTQRRYSMWFMAWKEAAVHLSMRAAPPTRSSYRRNSAI